MSTSKGSDKSREVVAHIAKASGVEEAAVEKVLTHLGLHTALERNPNAVASGLKIAAAPIMQ